MDAYVEDAVQPDFKSGRAVMFQSVNPEVKKHLEQLAENLELEDRVYGDLWHLGKYGDYFNLLLIDEEKGVFDACPLEPRIVWRHEDSRRVLRGFSVGDASENSTDTKLDIPKYKPWDVIHWRLRSRRIQDPYGSPFFFHARQIYKMLKLMEEQMVVYRMNMHPDRLVFKVFTGNAGPEERRRVVRQWRREMEHNTMIDRSTGMMRSEFAPWMINNNVYWPVGSGDATSGVDKLSGSANAGDCLDVEYMRLMFFAAVRVPKAYMGLEDSQGYRGSETLSGQSVKFARGVKRLQKHYLQGLMRLAKIHLAVRGVDYREPSNAFAVSMSPTSYLDEAQRAELYAKRFEALNVMLDIGAKMAGELGLNRPAWAEYVLKEFGGFDDETIMKFLAPSASTPDITMTPNDHSMTFEAELRERVANDSKLSKAAVELSDQSGIIVQERSNQSVLDLPSTKDLLSPDGRERYEVGKGLSERATATYEKEVADKRRERTEVLRRVAQEWAEKNQD
jgi:hypothetical protein